MRKGVLSSQFNMSVGFVPTLIAMLLCELMAKDVAVYVGTGIGVLWCLCTLHAKSTRIPQLILYGTTGILCLLSAIVWLMPECCSAVQFLLLLEIATMLPPLFLFVCRKRLLHLSVVKGRSRERFWVQGVEAAVVSARVMCIAGTLHLLLIAGAFLVGHRLEGVSGYILFHLVPMAVFIFCILFNQFGIYYFNRVMGNAVFVPVVNRQGDVIGRTMLSEAIASKNEYLLPVVRIMLTSGNMMYLCPRPQEYAVEMGKMDLPMESYLLYGETLEQAAWRVLHQSLPAVPAGNLHFNFVYYYEDEASKRLTYLFTLELEDESSMNGHVFKGGKLWTLSQIEQNLCKNFFSYYFEYEYEQLKSIIYTRGKYKES